MTVCTVVFEKIILECLSLSIFFYSLKYKSLEMAEKFAFQMNFSNCLLVSLCLDLTNSRCYQRQMTQTGGILC